MKTRFKDRSLQRCYEMLRKAGADPSSELYCSPLGPDGPRCPRNGAAHRCAYWQGRAGVTGTTVAGSLSRACWAAGQGDAKELGGISPRWLGLGILGSGLVTKGQLWVFLESEESHLPWNQGKS